MLLQNNVSNLKWIWDLLLQKFVTLHDIRIVTRFGSCIVLAYVLIATHTRLHPYSPSSHQDSPCILYSQVVFKSPVRSGFFAFQKRQPNRTRFFGAPFWHDRTETAHDQLRTMVLCAVADCCNQSILQPVADWVRTVDNRLRPLVLDLSTSCCTWCKQYKFSMNIASSPAAPLPELPSSPDAL